MTNEQADGSGVQALNWNVREKRAAGWGVANRAAGDVRVSINTGTLGTGTNTLTVAAGDALLDGSTTAIAETTVSIDAGGALPRKDVVYLDATGATAVAGGRPEAKDPPDDALAAAERPAPPDLQDVDGVILALILVPADATSIDTTNLVDLRARADQEFALTTADEASVKEQVNPFTHRPQDQRHVDFINWRGGWTDMGIVTSGVSGFAQPDIMTPDGTTYYAYYEYLDANNNFQIGLATSDSVDGPYDTVHEPILSSTGTAGDPDEVQIADPTVLHLPWASPNWHMWFDMDAGSNEWTCGKATSTDGITWTKQDSNGDGTTDILIDIGDYGSWDDDFTHCPEAFLYDGKVHVLYGAKGSNHTDYATGLAIADDSDGLGSSLQKWGQVTDDTTRDNGTAIRIKRPISIGGTLYAPITHVADTDSDFIGASHDGGRTWVQAATLPSEDITSFLLENGTLYGTEHDTGRMYSKGVY